MKWTWNIHSQINVRDAIGCLVQDCHHSSEVAYELLQSCTKLLKYMINKIKQTQLLTKLDKGQLLLRCLLLTENIIGNN